MSQLCWILARIQYYTFWETTREFTHFFFIQMLVNILELELLCILFLLFSSLLLLLLSFYVMSPVATCVCTHYRWQCIVVYICKKKNNTSFFSLTLFLFYFVALCSVCYSFSFLIWRDTLFWLLIQAQA